MNLLIRRFTMRSGLVALGAVTGVAAVLVLAPATTAAYAGSVKATVVPSTSTPGSDVEIRVTGCKKGTTGVARSPAFVADAELSAVDGPTSQLSGNTMVRSSVKPGTYRVNVTCDGHDHPGAGSVQVVRHHPTHQPTHRPTHTQEPTHHETPVAPVGAGGGGAAPLAARGDDVNSGGAGPGIPHTVIGLVLAGVAAVVVAFRTLRRRHRRTDAD
jgi:hypothetical protein